MKLSKKAYRKITNATVWTAFKTQLQTDKFQISKIYILYISANFIAHETHERKSNVIIKESYLKLSKKAQSKIIKAIVW